MPSEQPSPFLTAEWRHLALLNYDIDPAILAPFVPEGTRLDLLNGQALVSVVGFRFLGTRLRGLRLPIHRNFSEVNLRFYVTAGQGNDVRHGVVFIKEIVPWTSIALAARFFYNEPYVARDMRSHLPPAHPCNLRIVQYEWRAAAGWDRVLVEAEGGEPEPMGAGSDERFITERHWGYTRQRNGSTNEYRVDHVPWKFWKVRRAELVCDIEAMYGREFRDALSVRPRSAMLATGSAVSVFAPRRLNGSERQSE